LGNKYCSTLPKIAAARILTPSCRFSTNPGLDSKPSSSDDDPSRPRRHPQSFVSPDEIELGLGELETELPPGYHQELHRRDRGPKKPRQDGDGKDSYWRPPWKSPRAEIVSAADFANRPRVTFSESFESLHDAMAVLSWMSQDDKDGMYDLYLKLMTNIAAGQEKRGKSPRGESWGVLSAHTSHEYVVRAVAQEYNVTTSRAAGVIQLQHNEEQLKKDPDFVVNHKLQAEVDAKVRERIREVYRSYGEKDPLEFVEDPVASTGTIAHMDFGSPEFVQASELTDVDALAKKVRMQEIADAKVRIANHIYVEDVDDRTRKVKVDQEVTRLLKMQKEMGSVYDDDGGGDVQVGDDDEEDLEATQASEEEEGDEKEIEGSANYFEEAMRARSPQKRWKAKRESSVFVRNIPYDAASRDLKEHMGVAGDVVSAEIFTTPSKVRHMGRGIVTFSTPEAAKKAIEKLNDTDLKGRTISVEKATGSDDDFEEEAKVTRAPSLKKWDGKRENSVFIGNIPSEALFQDLKDHMSPVGDVVRVNVGTARNGWALGWGFVEFSTLEATKEAIEKLNGTDFKGHSIRVKELNKGKHKKEKEAAEAPAGNKEEEAEVPAGHKGEEAEATEPPKTWGRRLWASRGKHKSAPPPKRANEPAKQPRTKVPKSLTVPVGASPYPENGRGHKEDPGTRRPRWKYTAQVVNTHMMENPPGSKRHGKRVAALAKGRRHGRVIDGNTIIEEGGELRVASVAELEKTSWKHVRNESEFMFKGVKEAWLKRQLEGEVGGWGRQEEVNKPKPEVVEGKADDDAEEAGEDGSAEEEKEGGNDKERT